MRSDFVLTPIKETKRIYAASATVEAAIVIPLFVYFVLTLSFLIRFIQIKQDVNLAAYNSIRQLSKYAYVYDLGTENNELINLAAIYGELNNNLGLDFGKENYIVGGNAGIILIGSGLSKDSSSLVIKISYAVKNPFNIFGGGYITVKEQFETEAWLGEKKSTHWNKDKDKEGIVYVTQYGEVYHVKRDCTYLQMSVSKAFKDGLFQQRNVNGAKYYACESCASEFIEKNEEYIKTSNQEYFYVTNYGDRFHTDINCRKIKRTVLEVYKSAIGDRRACKKCGGG